MAEKNTSGTGTACAKETETLDFSSDDASISDGSVPIGVYVELSSDTEGTLTCRLIADTVDIALKIGSTGVYPYSVQTVRNTGTTEIAKVIALF